MIVVKRPRRPSSTSVELELGLGVERRRRLVEDQHLRVVVQRAGDAEALALAARELHAALADHLVEPVGERPDDVVELRERRARAAAAPRRPRRGGTPSATFARTVSSKSTIDCGT